MNGDADTIQLPCMVTEGDSVRVVSSFTYPDELTLHITEGGINSRVVLNQKSIDRLIVFLTKWSDALDHRAYLDD